MTAMPSSSVPTDLKSSGGISEELRKLSSEEEAEDPRLALFLRLVRWAPGWLCRLLVGLPRYGPKLWVEQRGGAFALTSVGKYGMDVNYAKWPWPLTFTMGEIKRRPVVAGDAVVARSSFHLSMGYDHRLANGGQAARFNTGSVDGERALCISHQVVKIGDRWAVIESLLGTVRYACPTFGPCAAQGVSLHHDLGQQFTARDFRHGLRFLGIKGSPAFVGKLGYRTPAQLKGAFLSKQAQPAA